MRLRWVVGAVLATAAVTGGSVAAIAAPSGSAHTQPAGGQVRVAPAVTPVDSAVESKFTPIVPCRVFDSRHAAAGALTVNSTRGVRVSGTFGFAPQGGTSGGCGIPVAATAIAANVVAVNSPALGVLTGWAAGTPEPGTSFLNYAPHNNVSTGTVLPINTALSPDLDIVAGGSGVNVVIDVTGYYVKPMRAVVASDGSLTVGSRVTSSFALATGRYEVDFDRDVSMCTYAVSPEDSGFTAITQPRDGNVDGVFVLMTASDNQEPDNAAFFLTVTC